MADADFAILSKVADGQERQTKYLFLRVRDVLT